MMNEIKKVCDLCGLSVEIRGITLTTKESVKSFCCEGCKGIYQMLNNVQALPEPKQEKKAAI